MNRWLYGLLGASLLFASGCEGWLAGVPKNTVMVKKIAGERQPEEAYEGILSQDAVKTLSLSAINKFYDQHLTMDGLQFELRAVDQNKIKDLLVETNQARARPQGESAELRFDYKPMLDRIPGGLYTIILTQLKAPKEVFEVVLNARDGDVLKLSRTGASRQSEPAVIGREKVFTLADRFLEEKGIYPFAELAFNPSMTRWGVDAELYYTDITGQSLRYGVTVSNRRNEVVGFSKDVMALLGYYSRL
ncbi:hypothetical protein ACFFNY_27790 [Paenibacillus hodogayensis]|uniref:Lipoprotein n=1 Tax=Paenibacillus hodogayensis TaxID=279208 RepID=A0ABV5W4Q6_9BACL